MVSVGRAKQEDRAVRLDIQALNSEGQGVARLEGLAVFVSGAIPGDQVEAIIEQQKSNYAVARLLRILRPSADRTEPFCPVADRCGGCTLQPLRYEAQLRLKQEQVISALVRIGGFADADVMRWVRPVIGMQDPRQYRSKVQFPVTGKTGSPKIGFFASRSHAVVDHTTCGIQHPAADAVRAVIRAYMIAMNVAPYQEATHDGLLRHIVVRMGFATGQVMVILVINGETLPALDTLAADLITALLFYQTVDGRPFTLHSLYLNHHRHQTNLVMGENMTLIHGEAQIEEHLLGLRYRISPLAFFQVNPPQTEVLYQTALDFAGLTGQETVLDLYCGTGSISLLLARAARHVIGVEAVPQAIEDARMNAELNNLADRVTFQVGKAETILPTLAKSGIHVDVALVDPPRKGCETALLDAVRVIGPSRFVYVSCNPATLARDLAYLAQDGRYQITTVQPVDLFPWTNHVETVVLMSRVETGKV